MVGTDETLETREGKQPKRCTAETKGARVPRGKEKELN